MDNCWKAEEGEFACSLVHVIYLLRFVYACCRLPAVRLIMYSVLVMLLAVFKNLVVDKILHRVQFVKMFMRNLTCREHAFYGAL